MDFVFPKDLAAIIADYAAISIEMRIFNHAVSIMNIGFTRFNREPDQSPADRWLEILQSHLARGRASSWALESFNDVTRRYDTMCELVLGSEFNTGSHCPCERCFKQNKCSVCEDYTKHKYRTLEQLEACNCYNPNYKKGCRLEVQRILRESQAYYRNNLITLLSSLTIN